MKEKQKLYALPSSTGSCSCSEESSSSSRCDQQEGHIRRRDFLKSCAYGLASIAALPGCVGREQLEEYFQKHFRELNEQELKEVIARLEAKYKKQYGVDLTVDVSKPIPNVLFGYGLDIGRCIGCRRCVYACVKENNQSRDPQIQWIKVFEMEKEKGIDFHHATPYYEHETVPRKGKFYFPVQCQQCKNPPCVRVCPTGATWKDEDGIVVIDYNWCIGCRYCMAACPYGARRFNWGDPNIPAKEINPNTHYLGNRPRSRGVVEKCTFCVQRVRKGLYPACVEICPVGARTFGNLLDPKSEIRKIMENKRTFILKADLFTQPKFYYFYGVDQTSIRMGSPAEEVT